MSSPWIRKPVVAALGLAATLSFAVAGCGGKTEGPDDAVVVTDPSVSVSTPGSQAATTTTTAAPAETASTSGKSAAPAENVKASGWGTLKGQITFVGTVPVEGDLQAQGKADKDKEVCAKNAPIKNERLVVDGTTKAVKNVLVYIPKPTAVNPEAKSAASQVEVEFDQKNCTFEPHVIGLMTGAKVMLKNSDPVNHNVDSKLKNNPLNPNLAPSQTQAFVTQGSERTPQEVICDIHPWMKSYWMVTDSPYVAVTDAKGNFEIKNVPAGTQKVVVWQESVTSGGFVTPASGESVNIKADGTTTLDLKIDAGKIRPK